MFPVDGHTSPALLSIVIVFHYKVTFIVLHTSSFLTNSVINNVKRRGVAQVEVGSMPGKREETLGG